MPRLFRLATFLLALGPAAVSAQTAAWTGSWSASPTAASAAANSTAGKTDSTFRETVHLSLGGSAFRVVLTNEFGTDPLTIAATTARPTGQPATAVLFGGKPSVTIAPGAFIASDAVPLTVAPLSDISLNLFVPSQTISVITQHGSAFTTNSILPGNQIASPTAVPGKETTSWRYLKNIEVAATPGTRAVVTFGDSITDGARSTIDGNARWSDVLARRLAASPATANVGVLNQGIGGNRILHDITGPAALARFDRDVLQQPGARYLIMLEGINDITHNNPKGKLYDPIAAADLIAALRYIIDRAHAHGLKVYGATLTPYANCACANPDGIALHEAENAFIRSGAFDAVIDFDKVTRDPAHPGNFLPAFDSGDHLHPNDAGYKAMGESIDLALFAK